MLAGLAPSRQPAPSGARTSSGQGLGRLGRLLELARRRSLRAPARRARPAARRSRSTPASLREPGGDRAGGGEGGRLVLVVDRAVGEDGDLGPRVPPGLLGAAVDVVEGELDAVRVQPGQQDDAVGDPAGQLERLRPGGRNPDRDGAAPARTGSARRRTRTRPPRGDVLPGPQRADGLDRRLQVGEPRGLVPDRQQRPVARADAEREPAPGDLGDGRRRRGGDRRDAG